MTSRTVQARLHGLTVLRRSGTGRSIARTAAFNVTATIAASLGGILLARAIGPTMRGEYAAITSWFGFCLMFGAMGQPAALCFYLARDPGEACSYIATARAMMLTTGTLVLTAGLLLAPLLAHGHPEAVTGYRIVFSISIIAFVAASYTFALQASDLKRWNVVRTSQPLLSFACIAVLWYLHLLTLNTALLVLALATLAQLCWAYWACRATGLVPGKVRVRLARPLASYGLAQIAAVTPAALNADLDKLILSQTVPPADLGRYAIAVSLTSLPIPLVAAFGNVAFPRLAARKDPADRVLRLQRLAVLGSVGLATAVLAPLAAVAYWLVPAVFGAGYRGVVPLLWVLAPGAVCLACGQVVGDLLRGRNRPVVVAWSQGLAAVFTVALLIILLPIAGIYGAAIASTIAYGVALAVMLRSLWHLPADGKKDQQTGAHKSRKTVDSDS